MGAEGNLDPWLAQFSTRAMDFQSRVLARTAEFHDLPMDLRTAAILQQLDMFLAMARMLPAICPLSYPVPTPRSQAMLPPALVGEAGKGRSAKPKVKSITGVPGSSSTEPLKPGKPVPTPAPRATATSCRAGGVGGPAVALQDVPGSYSYTSIISRGFTPSSAERPPVAERVTTFGVTTPPAITQVTGGRAPPVLIQTVAPSTMTATITPAILTSSSGPQRPIDCKPLGAKRRHKPAPPKMAEPTPDPNTLDHESAPIPVIVLDDEDSDPQQLTIDAAPSEERSPTVVPEKKARVWASPVQVKSVEAAGAAFGLQIAKAYADQTLGSVSSSDDSDPPSSIVTKPQKKRQSKKKRDGAKGQAPAAPSSDSDGHTDNKEGHADNKEDDSNVEGLCSSLNRSALIDSIHAKARDADFPFIKLLRQEHNLPKTGMTQEDVSDFLTFVSNYRAEKMGDPLLHKKHIWSMGEVIEAMHRNLPQPKTDDNKVTRSQWKKVVRQLQDYRDVTPMPEAQECKGVLPHVHAKFVTRIFVKPDGKPLSNNAKMLGDDYKRVVLGLTKLHKKEAISHQQEKGVDGGSICSFCCLSFSKHESVNNHVRVHWRLALMCALCSRVEVDVHEMICHGRDEHGLQVP